MFQKKLKIAKEVIWPQVCLMLFLGVMGCATSSPQPRPEQLAAQLQAQKKKSAMQEKLLAQIGRTTISDYRDYAVGSEDLLTVSFFGLTELDREVRVNGQGEISLPLVETVKVAGLSPLEIEKRLIQQYKEGEFLENPQISVNVKDYRHQRVMVTGAVAQPGSYEVIGPRTLLEMLGKAGGLNDRAGEMAHIIRPQGALEQRKALKGSSSVQSFAPGTETIMIDLNRLVMKGSMELNMTIKSGDVIHVPFARNAYILGSVNKAGNVPVKDNITATQAVAMAGGQNIQLASNNVTIVRLDDKGAATTLQLNLGAVTTGKEPDIVLKENDIVFVQESGVRRFFYDFKNLFPGSVSAGASMAAF